MNAAATLAALNDLLAMLDELSPPMAPGWPELADEVDYADDVLIRLDQARPCVLCQAEARWLSLLLGVAVCGQGCYDTLISPSWEPA